MKRLYILVILILALSVSGCKKEETIKIAQLNPEAKTKSMKISVKDYGTISFKLYHELEPKVVDKFTELCEKGFYKGKSIYTIIEDYVLLAGSRERAENTQSFTSGDFTHLLPFYGALCANLLEDDECNLSSFYIINNSKDNIAELEKLVAHKGYSLADYIKFGYKVELFEDELDLYRERGGAPWLYGHTVVFGQMTDGYEILDEIVKAHSEDEDSEFIIENITID